MPDLTPEERAEQLLFQQVFRTWLHENPSKRTAAAHIAADWFRAAEQAAERRVWKEAYKLLCADCRAGTPLTNKSGKSWGECWVHLDGKVQLGICGADTLRRRAPGGRLGMSEREYEYDSTCPECGGSGQEYPFNEDIDHYCSRCDAYYKTRIVYLDA